MWRQSCLKIKYEGGQLRGHVVLDHGSSYILVKVRSAACCQALFSVEALLWECLTLYCVTRFWVGVVDIQGKII